VNNLQNAGLLSPQPSRIRLTRARRPSSSCGLPTWFSPAAPAPERPRGLTRVRDRDRPAARNPEKRKPIETRSVDHRFQIVDPRIEADIVHVALRHAIATLVVTEDAMVKRARRQPVR